MSNAKIQLKIPCRAFESFDIRKSSALHGAVIKPLTVQQPTVPAAGECNLHDRSDVPFGKRVSPPDSCLLQTSPCLAGKRHS